MGAISSKFAEFLEVSGLTCEATVAVKDVVRSDVGVIKRALADSIANSGAIGICIAKTSPTVCTILFAGQVKLLFTGLDDTKDYFLSPTVPGGLTTTVPVGAGNVILRIGRAMGADRLIVQIGSRIQRAL